MTWPSFDPTHFLIDLVTEKSFKIVSEFPVKRTPNFPALVLSSQTRPRLSTHPLRWASVAQVAKHWTLVLKVATSNPAVKEALYCSSDFFNQLYNLVFPMMRRMVALF